MPFVRGQSGVRECVADGDDLPPYTATYLPRYALSNSGSIRKYAEYSRLQPRSSPFGVSIRGGSKASI
ncbi:MAG: hypothetical protein JWO87_3895 [Phycisphaerales bacterium]|nr:hypothetical protein [Phycisphaerales bacterium]